MKKEEDQTTVASSSDDKSKNAPLASAREVFSFATSTQTWLQLAAGFLCAAMAGLVVPAMIFYFAATFEDLGASTGNDDFLKSVRELAYAFMILGVIAGVGMIGYNTLLNTAAGTMTKNLKTIWFDALLRQDMAFFDIKDVSGTATIISRNGAKYKKGLGSKLGQGVQMLVTFVGGYAYSFYASWRVSLVTIAIAPFTLASVSFLLKMNTSQTARANKSYSKAGSVAYTTVSSIRTILSLNAIEIMIKKYTAATQEAYDGAVSQVMLLGVANGMFMGSFLLAYLPVTLYGAYLLYDNVKSSGCDPSGTVDGVPTCDPAGKDVFGALMGITFSSTVLPQVSAAIEAFTDARAACFEALATVERKLKDNTNDGSSDSSSAKKNEGAPDEFAPVRRGSTALPPYKIDSSSPNGLKPETVKGNLEFHNVSFAYPTRREVNVFDGLSLSISSGKTVALVGPSGSGKSTTIQLIERFYDPTAGRVTLDGVDLKDLNVKWLRQHIGLVSQEPNLFATTIRENIAYGCPGATDEEIEEAAKVANCHDFISKFPDGYNTHVGDRGAQLSGGQKQRIAIARVLVKNPRIILLDEATSALDSESEAVVQAAIDKLMALGDRTTVVIAHRLSTIKNADMIAVVKDGNIHETGNHETLIEKKGIYYDLVQAQTKGNDTSSAEESAKLVRKESSAGDEVSTSLHGEGSPILRFCDVHFSYPSRPDNEVFRGLNLTVREGETLALVGPSGQGKSTTIQLIERFYEPTEGTIEFNGVDLKEVNVKWLRDQLALVSQEPVLFDTSIMENLRYGLEDATDEQIEEAARMANAHDFITSFPDGYETQVGEGSTQVSGGQKQRIAIARALLKKPRILLLDEATSALDSESEKVVQECLDNIMKSAKLTTIVIAHRLSTIRNADRIAVIDHGRVKEIGSHEELMEKTNGRYRRLYDLQNLQTDLETDQALKTEAIEHNRATAAKAEKDEVEDTQDDEEEVDKEDQAKNSKRARLLGSQDKWYFLVGAIGAIFAGIIWPAWGWVFAYMIEVFYSPVYDCDEADPIDDHNTCSDYWHSVADDMQDTALKIFYAYIGIMLAVIFGYVLLFYGFGTASEKMNKRVRDAAFKSLVRQEISWFDVRSVGSITSQLADDAALIHAFAGEPIRTFVLTMASITVGLVVSFYFMWPFALLTLGMLPFMAFGAEMEMKMYMGEDEGGEEDLDEHSPGGVVVESLYNIRTVAALALEENRSTAFSTALSDADPSPIKNNFLKGCAGGLGQFCQYWGIALMFWWGGWLLLHYGDHFSYRDYLISMFALLFAISGLGVAAQGVTDKDKAMRAAQRIFELTDRQSLIDPLSEEGLKDI